MAVGSIGISAEIPAITVLDLGGPVREHRMGPPCLCLDTANSADAS